MRLFFNFLLASGIMINLVILFFLFREKKRTLPNKVLIWFFSFMFVYFITSYGEYNRSLVLFLLGSLITIPGGYLLGPLLLLYVKSLFLKNNNLFKSHWVHFLPFIIAFVFIAVPVVLSAVSDDVEFGYIKLLKSYKFPDIDNLLQGVSMFLYAFFSLRLFNRCREAMKLNFSSMEERDLTWVKYLLIGVLSIICIDTITTIYEIVFGESEFELGFFTIIPLFLLLMYLAYYGVAQSSILLPDFIVEDEIELPKQAAHKKVEPNKVLLNEEEWEQQKQRLLEVFEEKKPYLDNDLTLGALAQLIPTSDKKLSTLLNQYMNVSFYDLINQYRVEEVKAKINNPDFEHYTLLAIAFDSGFKSKTSFNRIFKKNTGLSPSAYKKQL